MKRMVYVWCAAAVLAVLLGAGARAQSGSLGDYARQVRKTKSTTPAAARQFDNDNLPRTQKLSVVGEAPAEAQDKAAENQSEGEAEQAEKPDAKEPAAEGKDETADKSAAKPQTAQHKDEAKSGDAEAEQQKFYDGWKKRIEEQKDAIELATRELDVAQREYRLRAAAFYADAGNRLRNQGSWDKEDAQYKQQIADKQKAVDDAKQKLEDLREEARKAGVPPSMRE